MTEADLADECRILRDGGEVKEGGEEVVDDAVGGGGKRASPILPWGCALGEGEVVEDVAGEKMGEFLERALGKKMEAGLKVADIVM